MYFYYINRSAHNSRWQGWSQINCTLDGPPFAYMNKPLHLKTLFNIISIYEIISWEKTPLALSEMDLGLTVLIPLSNSWPMFFFKDKCWSSSCKQDYLKRCQQEMYSTEAKCKTALGFLPEQNLSLYPGKKEGNVLFNDALNMFLFTVIWHQTYGKGPFR